MEFIEGSEREVLAEIRRRWPGLPIHPLPYAVVTEGVNGRRVNPAGVPVRIELAHAGAGQWLALVLDARGTAIEAIAGTKPEVLAEIHRRWPDLPVVEMPFVRENPAGLPRKEAGQISDRGLRYRANSTPPPGRGVCSFCGAAGTTEIGHANGDESDGSPANLLWTCRSCNVICGNVLRRAGIGRLTHQYNPSAENQGARTLGQWVNAVFALKGQSTTMTVPAAVEMARATDPETRSQFAHEIWRLRRQRYGPSGRPDATPF